MEGRLQMKAVLVGLLTVLSLAYTIDNELHRSLQFGLRRSLIVNSDALNGTSPTSNATGSRRPGQGASVEESDDDGGNGRRVGPPGFEKTLLDEYWADENYTNDGCNLGGRVIKVAVAPQPPLVDCVQDSYGDWTCTGSNIEVINLLEQRLNFRAEWVVLASTGPGESSKSFSETNYTGVIGIVASGRAWLSANGLVKTVDREANLLMSEPFDFFRFHFLLSKSVRDHDHLFLKPFSAKTWWALLASALAIFPLMYLLNSTSAHYALRDDPLLRQVSGWRCFRWLLLRLASAPCRLVWALCGLLCCCWCCCFTSNKKKKKKQPQLSKTAPQQNKRKNGGSPSRLARRDSLERQVHGALSKPNGRLALELAKPRASGKPAKLSREQRRLQRRLLERQWALERRRNWARSRRARKSGFSKWPYTLWYVLGSLAYQGGEEENLPTASSTRLLIMFWWFYLIVVSSYHSGILTAILSFPRQPDFIQTLEDFMSLEAAERGAVKLWTDQGGELAELLSSPDNLHKSALLELAQESAQGRYPIHKIDFKRQRQRLLDVVASGRAAYMEDRGTINLIITQEYLDQRKCLFKSSRFPIDVQPMSLVLNSKLTWPCIRFINRLMVRILRTGLSQKWRRQHEPLGNDCLHTVIINAGNVAKIELRHVIFAFWLLAGGMVLGALLLLLELLWLFTADLDSDLTSDSSDADNTDDDDDASSVASSASSAAGSHSAASAAQRGARKRDKKSAEQAGKRAASEAKRKKRVKRAIDMFSTLLEGRVYAGFLSRLSDNVQSQARRASQALLHIPRSLVAAGAGLPEDSEPDEPVRRRHRLNDTKVAPL